MEYDEIRITTRREIEICKGAIRKLEKKIEAMGKKSSMPGPPGLRDLEMAGGGPDDAEYTRWRECCQALERWKQRLQDHLQIMRL